MSKRNNSGNNKSKQYDLIKVITTFLVVIAHSTRMYTGNGVIHPLNESMLLSNVTDFIYAFHMPLYMAISGSVYGMCIDDLGKYSDTCGFIKNKAVRLLIPYYLFGFIYVAPVMIIFHFTDSGYLEYCVNGIFLVKNSRHLWFIFTLFLIFLICALTKKIIQKASYLIVLPLLLALAILSGKIINIFRLDSVAYYLFFFYIGYLFNKYYVPIIRFCKNPLILCMSIGFQIVLSGETNSLIKILLALAGIIMISGLSGYINVSLCDKKFFRILKKNGFGVYLFHPMIIYVLYYYLGNYNISPIVLCFIVILTAYFISHLLTNLLRKLNLGIVMGE